MPAIQQTDDGDEPRRPHPPRTPQPRHRRKPRRTLHGRRSKRTPSSRPKAPSSARPTVPATQRAPQGTLGDPWQQRATVDGGSLTANMPLTLTGDAGLGSVILELVGAERVSLGTALGAWQREQDRLLNRAWRRPGGLARPGNV